MEHSSLKPEAQQAVDGYADRLVELLQACARHRHDDPEAFLWNARRSLEATCHLFRSAVTNERSEGKAGSSESSLEWIIQDLYKKDRLDLQQKNRWDHIRDQANLGVHIRRPEKEDFPAAVDDVAHALPGVVRWVVQQSKAARHLSARRRELLLAGAEAIQRPPQPAPEHQEVGAKAPLIAEVELEAPPGPSRTVMVLLGLGALLGTALGAALSVWWMARSATQAPPAAPSAEPPAALEARIEAPAPTVEAPPPCPDGMIRVPELTVHIGQPIGRGGSDWPAPHPAAIDPLTVPSFCVDVAPRSRAQLALWPGSEAVRVPDCDWRTQGSDEDPAVCIDRASAAAYCAATVQGGLLPTLVEWEALARSEHLDLAQGEVLREWAADLFPPAALNRRPKTCTSDTCSYGMFRERLKRANVPDPDGNLLFGWHEQAPANGWKNLGFRCAWSEPSPATTP